MKLVRVGAPGAERPGVLLGTGEFLDVSDSVADFDEAFFASDGLVGLADLVAGRWGVLRSLDEQRLGAPIARPHQVICIGLNYADHAAETGQPVPTEPIVFTKSPNTVIGPDDTVLIPRGAIKTDWEVELGVVIGMRTRYLHDHADAIAHIAGYVISNDVSEREFQLERGGQWSKGKSAETFNPCGPWLVTPDEIPDVSALSVWLDVNGASRQRGSTATMLFSPAFLVHYLSQFMILEPGDLINTGTPPGVGMSADPPAFLRAGDVMELGISGLGTQRQLVGSAP